MSFPISPTEGQTTTVNGINYVYSATYNSWTRVPSNAISIRANAAFDTANAAFIQANTPSHVANSAAIYANGAFVAANSATDSAVALAIALG